jgi:hypothetical protein
MFKPLFKKLSPYPVFIITGLLIYFPILSNQLLDFWDDQWVVMNYFTEGGNTLQHIWRILTEFYHGQYAPFNQYLYLFLYSISGGYNPFVFHLASLLIHLANCCLVFVVLRKLLLLNGKIEVEKIQYIAFITALICTVHPFNVESVAWMSASKILVYAFFYLSATYTFLFYIESGKKRFYVLTMLLFAFSFLGKEQAVTFPVWLLLIYWITNHRLSDKRIWIKTLPFFVFALIFGIITIYSQYAVGSGVLSDKADYPVWQRLVFACYAWFEYLFKILFPIRLSYLYPFPIAVGDPLPFWLLLYPIIIIVSGVSLWKFIKKPPVLLGLIFFTVHIAVALHIIPLSRFAVVADRYAYIALPGIAFIIARYVVMGYHYAKSKRIKQLIVVLFTACMLYCGIYAHLRTYVWYDSDTLKREMREAVEGREYRRLQ